MCNKYVQNLVQTLSNEHLKLRIRHVMNSSLGLMDPAGRQSRACGGNNMTVGHQHCCCLFEQVLQSDCDWLYMCLQESKRNDFSQQLPHRWSWLIHVIKPLLQFWFLLRPRKRKCSTSAVWLCVLWTLWAAGGFLRDNKCFLFVSAVQ